MKNILLKLILTWLSLMCIAHLVAQELPTVQGSVIIEEAQLEKQGNNLCLTLKVHVKDKAMNHRQDWSILPELTSANQKVCFPGILINGKQKERHFHRKENYKNTWLTEHYPAYHTYIVRHTDTLLVYRETVPYETWMDHSTLTLHQILGSSRQKRQLFSSISISHHKPEVIEIPTPTPPEPQPPVPATKRTVTNEGACLITYPINESKLQTDFMDNESELRKIETDLRPLLEDPDRELVAIHITGHASPEGPAAYNEQLAAQRTESLKTYLAETYRIQPTLIWTRYVAEDWTVIRPLIQSSEMAGKDKILSIIDSDASNIRKEQQLRALPQWRQLVKDYLPLIRKVDYKLTYIITEK